MKINNIKRVVAAVGIIGLIGFTACGCTSAKAAQDESAAISTIAAMASDPIQIVSGDTYWSENFNRDDDTIYIVKEIGIVDSDAGDGHVKGHENEENNYISYATENLDPGTEVTSYMVLDDLGEVSSRFDFVGKNLVYTS